jgi:cysteine desulfurase
LRNTIYLDHNSTSPMDPRVLRVMYPFFIKKAGNPSGGNPFNQELYNVALSSKQYILNFLNANEGELIFTSGATESNNLGLQGLGISSAFKTRFLASAIEHASVLGPLSHLKKNGCGVTEIPVDRIGKIDLNFIERDLIKYGPAVIVVMAVNNETGVIQPIGQIGALSHQYGCRYFCDATQAIDKIQINMSKDHIDVVSFSGHKIYGPHGTGVLALLHNKYKKFLSPIFFGGGQQNNIRPGTLNLAGIVGLEKSIKIIDKSDMGKIRCLMDQFLAVLMASINDLEINSGNAERIANTVNLFVPGVDSKDLIQITPEIVFSSSSACSDQKSYSHVLKAMGYPLSRIQCSFRIGLGKETSKSEIDRAAKILVQRIKIIKRRN